MIKLYLLTVLISSSFTGNAAAGLSASHAAFLKDLQPASFRSVTPEVSEPQLKQITNDFPLVFAKSAGKLKIGINPNRELMYSILHLTEYSKTLRGGNMHPLAAAVLKKLGKFRDHPAVAELDNGGRLNWKNGLRYDAFSEFPGYFSALPEGRRMHPYDDAFLDRVLRGMSKEEKVNYLDAYWEKVLDFYQASDYADFFRGNSELYRSYVDSVFERLPAGDPARLHEDYHGNYGFENFYVVPSPLNLPPGGSFGGRIGPSIFNFMGYGYSDADAVKFLILHEFGHSFCNQAVSGHLGEAMKYGFLMQGISAEMGAQAYSGWETVMYELLVRSVHARLTLKTEGEEAAELFLLREEHEHKFVFIRDFYALLAAYEQERGRYPTVNDFYPRLLAALGNWRLAEIEEPVATGLWTTGTVSGLNIDWADPEKYAYAYGLRAGDTVTEVDGVKPAASFFLTLENGRTYRLTIRRRDGGAETMAFPVQSHKTLRPVRMEPR
ncbi:MAG: hypothetical protein A2X32_00600 [Elusimicrobia bacterium GWC2_64_44]|nr:MAG: hypothetical protein A2X32_00600 [Elusimicrobia bacterium GWC2_64_44]